MPDSPGHPFRVCFVSHSGVDGGAQRSMVDLIDALAARSVEPRVVLPEEGYVVSALQARMVPYVVYHYRPWTRKTPLPRWDRFLKKPLADALRAVKLSRLIGRWRCH